MENDENDPKITEPPNNNNNEESADNNSNRISTPLLLENPEPTDSNTENSIEDKRSCLQKTFGKMGPGSLRGSIFNLCILSLGTGLLSIPQKIGYMGLFTSPIIIILCGFANRWSLLILVNSSLKFKINSYEDIVLKLFGKKLSIFLSIIMCLNQSGIIILYQVILYKLTGGVINDFGKFGYKNVEEFAEKSFWSYFWVRLIVCYGITILILFPLCQLKNISKMRYASTFGIISLFFLMLIVVFECPFFIKKNIVEENQEINYYDVVTGLKGDMKFLQSLATLFYAFSCHVGTFPVLNTLANPTLKRQYKLINRAIFLDVFCYLIIGITGYLSQPLETPDLIIERNKIFDNDIVMTIGEMLFVFTLITKISANYNALRACIVYLLGYDLKNFPDKINLLITFLVLLCTTIIAVLFQSISDYLSLLGSFCTVLISFFIPGLIYIKGNDHPKYYYKNVLTMIFICFIVIIGFTSGFFTIRGIVNKYRNELI